MPFVMCISSVCVQIRHSVRPTLSERDIALREKYRKNKGGKKGEKKDKKSKKDEL